MKQLPLGVRMHDRAVFASFLPGSNGEALAAARALSDPDRAGAPALLYLHGTFRTLYRNYPKIDALRQAGFAVVAVDYRGWGDSTPIVPSERSIVADAESAWAELVRHQPDPGKRVVYGHSLGGAVAIDLASRKHCGADYGALIVESTFTTLADLAGSAGGPIGALAALLSGQRFDSIAKIGRIDAPILMLHGERDDTVPISLARRLRDAAPPGTAWVEVPAGGHSRLFEDDPELYQRTMRALITHLAASS